jgi:hypothetical protein
MRCFGTAFSKGDEVGVIILLLQTDYFHSRERITLSFSLSPAGSWKGRSSKQFSSSQCQTKDQSACLCFPVCAMFLRLFIYFHCGAAEIEKLLCQQPSVLAGSGGVIIAVRCFSSTNPAGCFPRCGRKCMQSILSRSGVQNPHDAQRPQERFPLAIC